jgi:hypothetical protein
MVVVPVHMQVAGATLDKSLTFADEGGLVRNLANGLPSCVLLYYPVIEKDHGTAARLAMTNHDHHDPHQVGVLLLSRAIACAFPHTQLICHLMKRSK